MVLKLPINVIILLFIWQWGLATIVGAPIGYQVYKAFSRAGVFS